MADELMTLDDMADGKLDLTTLKVYINGDKNTVNKPRLLPSVDVGSIAKLNESVNDRVNLQIATIPAGRKGYLTLAAVQAAQASLPANTLVEVTSDTDGTNNGVYLWDGTTLNKSVHDPLTQAKNYTDTKIQNEKDFNVLSSNIYEVTDAKGNPTWIQVAEKDGLPSEFAANAIKGALGTSDTDLTLIDGESILYAVIGENGNATALAVRASDGMFAQFVIDDIKKRLNIAIPPVNLDDLQYKPKPSDFQILSSIARGVARHTANKPKPINPYTWTNSTGQPSQLTFPNNYTDATPLILVICFEGAGDYDNLNIRTAYSDVLNNGVVWARCRLHQDSYGSPKAMQDAKELYQKACEIAPIGGVVLVGNSMGGTVLNALTTDAVPNILGVYLTDPVCDLRQRYDNGRKTEITTAYEIASDGSDYAIKTAGYDPMLAHWSKFKGVPISAVITTNDSAVIPSLHIYKLQSKLSAHNSITVIDTHSAGHNAPEQFIAANLINFIKQCASGAVITTI